MASTFILDLVPEKTWWWVGLPRECFASVDIVQLCTPQLPLTIFTPVYYGTVPSTLEINLPLRDIDFCAVLITDVINQEHYLCEARLSNILHGV